MIMFKPSFQKLNFLFRNLIIVWIIFFVFLFNVQSYSQDNETKELSDLFKMSLEELMNIEIVTAGKKKEKITDVPASVFIITREEIEDLGFSSFTEIMEFIPGFYMIDDYYWLGSVNFGVRGFFSTGPMNNIIILVNGVNQMSDKYSDFPDVKINVPVEAIDRIEVIKGPMSVIYGPGAFFGAINIITNDFEHKNNSKFVSVAYGSMNTQKAVFSYSQKNEEIKYSINASYCETEGIDVPFSKMTSDLSILEYIGLKPNATTAGQKDDQRKYFNFSLETKPLFADFSFAETQKDVFDGQPNLPRGTEINIRAINAVLGYKKEFTENLSGGIKFGYYSHNHMLDYELFRPYYYEVDGQNTNSYDLEINTFYKYNENLNFDFGLYRRTVLDIHQISDFGYYGLDYGDGEIGLPSGKTYSTHAVYLQTEYSPASYLNFIAGFRLDYLDEYTIEYARGTVTEDPADMRSPDSLGNRNIYRKTYRPDKDGFTPVSRLAVIYSPNANHIFKLLWGQATKQPSFSENYRQIPGGYPFLDAANISTIEFNYLFNVTNVLNFNLSFFNNQLDKLISTTNIYDNNTGEWEIFSYTSGKMETNGIECGLLWQLHEDIRWKTDLVYQKSNDLKTGYEDISLGYSPELLGYFQFIYTPVENKTCAIMGRYIDKMYTLWKTNTTPDQGKRIGKSIPGYYVVDVNLRYNKILDTDFYLELKMKNIFDQEIRYPTTTSNSWADKGIFGQGRNFLISLGWNFY